MSGNGQRLIAREGIPVLALLLILTAAAYVFLGLHIALYCLLLFVIGLALFRDPVCEIPSDPLAILSPANGKILSIMEMEDPWLERPAHRIRIKIAPWNSHCLRCPTEGKVMNQWSANDEEKEFDREYAYWIQTDEGDDVLMALGMGTMAPFTRITMVSGERVGQGQRCGYLYIAGIIDVFVPVNSRLKTAAGEWVRAGTGILGQFVHNNETAAVVAE